MCNWLLTLFLRLWLLFAVLLDLNWAVILMVIVIYYVVLNLREILLSYLVSIKEQLSKSTYKNQTFVKNYLEYFFLPKTTYNFFFCQRLLLTVSIQFSIVSLTWISPYYTSLNIIAIKIEIRDFLKKNIFNHQWITISFSGLF